MKRRFLQFSVRGLMGLAALVCLLLGGWRLLETYGSRVDLEAAHPFRIKARYFQVLGPSQCGLSVGLKVVLPGRSRNPEYWMTRTAGREWLCLYRMELECDSAEFQSDPPYECILTFNRYEDSDLDPYLKEWTIQEKVVEVK